MQTHCAVRSQPSLQWHSTDRPWRCMPTAMRMPPVSTVRTCFSHPVSSTCDAHSVSLKMLDSAALLRQRFFSLEKLSRMTWMEWIPKNSMVMFLYCSQPLPAALLPCARSSPRQGTCASTTRPRATSRTMAFNMGRQSATSVGLEADAVEPPRMRLSIPSSSAQEFPPTPTCRRPHASP